jgi:hypothetical protein
MSKLTIFILSTIISSFALADFEIPNQFEDGQVTSASQMNENFQALKSEIEALKSQLDASTENNKVTFVGITEEKFDGAGGLLAMGQACDAMVSGSFMCGVNEYKHSIKPSNLLISSSAWINFRDDYYILSSNCSGFSDSSRYGFFIDDNGNIVDPEANSSEVGPAVNCNIQRGIACCK